MHRGVERPSRHQHTHFPKITTPLRRQSRWAGAQRGASRPGPDRAPKPDPTEPENENLKSSQCSSESVRSLQPSRALPGAASQNPQTGGGGCSRPRPSGCWATAGPGPEGRQKQPMSLPGWADCDGEGSPAAVSTSCLNSLCSRGSLKTSSAGESPLAGGEADEEDQLELPGRIRVPPRTLGSEPRRGTPRGPAGLRPA